MFGALTFGVFVSLDILMQERRLIIDEQQWQRPTTRWTRGENCRGACGVHARWGIFEEGGWEKKEINEKKKIGEKLVEKLVSVTVGFLSTGAGMSQNFDYNGYII